VLAAPEGAVTEGFTTPNGEPVETLLFEADSPIELEFENQEPVAHNVQILDGPDDSAPSLFDGPQITGPATTTYEIAPLPPGEYFFLCRLHPGTAMQGTVVVEPGPPPGEGEPPPGEGSPGDSPSASLDGGG
jgi:hypothetical protein